jgi:hypothetical protein
MGKVAEAPAEACSKVWLCCKEKGQHFCFKDSNSRRLPIPSPRPAAYADRYPHAERAEISIKERATARNKGQRTIVDGSSAQQ